MKFLIIFAIVIAAARTEEDYSKYDNFDTDEVLANIRLFTAYVKCFIGEGKCTPEGNDIKRWIPEGIQSSCGKCSEKQKVLVAKMIKSAIEKLPEEWEKLKNIHNPDGKYDKPLEEFIQKFGN